MHQFTQITQAEVLSQS